MADEKIDKSEFLMVHKSLLPDYYEKFLEAKHLVNDEGIPVKTVCSNLDLSRSTYYKYMDRIIEVNNTYHYLFILKEDKDGFAFYNLIELLKNKGIKLTNVNMNKSDDIYTVDLLSNINLEKELQNLKDLTYIIEIIDFNNIKR